MDVLDWLSSWLKSLRDMATKEGFRLTSPRTVLTQPDRVLAGSTTDRKLDIWYCLRPTCNKSETSLVAHSDFRGAEEQPKRRFCLEDVA